MLAPPPRPPLQGPPAPNWLLINDFSLSPCPPHPLPLPPHTRSPPITGARSAGGPENLLVATHTRSLLVYRGSTLAWSARGDTQPAAVAVADLGPALRGVIVTLDDTGALVVGPGRHGC